MFAPYHARILSTTNRIPVNKPTDLARIPVDHDDIDTNVSSNDSFSTVLEARLSRRSLLRGGAATAASALLGAIGLSGCGGSDNGAPGERPYHPGYYAAFVIDPDGNNIEAVYHGEAKRSAASVKVTF